MEDLIRLIVQQVNITEEQARQTVNTVLGYVRDQLPAPVAAQVEAFLASGGASMMPGLTDLLQGFGNLAKGVGDVMSSGTTGGTMGGGASPGIDPTLRR